MPSDFGIVALATTFTGLIAIFKDLGLSMATVQREYLIQEQVSNLFWLNIAFSCVLALVVCIGAPFMASFFEDSRLFAITIASGLSLIIAGFTVQHQALLRRSMKFKTLAIVDVCSKFAGSAIAIVWAYFSKSYWALVFMPILSATFYALAMWAFCPWRPCGFKKRVGTMSMVNFGKDILHYGVINYFARNTDNFIVGKVAGAIELGYYSRSYSLMLVPVGQLVSPLTGVVVPALSKLQNNPIQYKRYYLQITNALAIVSFILVSLLFLLSSEVIDIFLGKQWSEAKLYFSILSFAAFWQPIISTYGWVLTSLGRPKRMVQWGYINSSSLIIVFFIGSLFNGALGVAYAYSVYTWFIVVPNFAFILHGTPIGILEWLKVVVKPLLFCVVVTGISYFIKNNYMNDRSMLINIVVTMLIELFMWGIYVYYDKSIITIFNKIVKVSDKKKLV